MGNLAEVFEAQPLRPQYEEPRQWFALLAAPSGERKACKWLRDRHFVPYWPSFTKQSCRNRGRRHPILCGVIPGYLFLPLALDDQPWQALLDQPGTPGIIDVLRDGGNKPAALTDRDIHDIRRIDAALNSSVICAESGIPFKVGERVRVVDGLLSSWSGPIIALDSERRISVEVELLGRQVPIWVMASQIEAM